MENFEKMKKIRIYLILLVVTFLLFSYSIPSKKRKPEPWSVTNEIKKDTFAFHQKNLDVTIIDKRLNDLVKNISAKGINTGNKSIPYTLTHQFYMPMLYAVQTNNNELNKSFESLMTFENVNNVSNSNALSDLDKKVFYFFASEYLRNYGISNSKNQKIYNLIRTKVLNYWTQSSGKVWKDEKNNFKGVKGRTLFILSGKENGKESYFRAITDHELFVMASGVSLGLAEKNSTGKSSAEMNEIADCFLKVLNQLIVFNNDGTWLLQPNIWKDHRDYKNSNNGIEGVISWDTSHFSRFPAYLNLLDIYTKNNTNNNFILKLKSGLAKQFMSKANSYDKTAKKYSFTNYINGNNDNYRVGFKTNLKGYGASQNNLHVFYGWWKLLNDNAINNMYVSIENNFSAYENENPQVKKYGELYKQIINLN